MRYLLSVMADRTSRVAADPVEIAAIDAFNDLLDTSGQRVMAVGVADAPTTFDNREGRGEVTDGPAVDSQLFIAGFWVIDVADEATARQRAAEASRACNRVIELRPFLD